MRLVSLFLAVLLSCTHTVAAKADLESLPERKDRGPQALPTASHITFESGVDAESVAVFMLELDQHIKAGEKMIVVELDTPGGSVGAGMAMSKAIEKSPVPVVCVVDGMAASMGLYILQSCDVRVMTKRSLLMGHEPAAMVRGQPHEMQELADLLTRLSRAMAYHITYKTALSVDDYLAKIHGGKELWMNVEDALAFKFVDFSVDSVDEILTIAQTANQAGAAGPAPLP